MIINNEVNSMRFTNHLIAHNLHRLHDTCHIVRNEIKTFFPWFFLIAQCPKINSGYSGSFKLNNNYEIFNSLKAFQRSCQSKQLFHISTLISILFFNLKFWFRLDDEGLNYVRYLLCVDKIKVTKKVKINRIVLILDMLRTFTRVYGCLLTYVCC